MKKLLSVLLSAICLIFFAIGSASCGDSSGSDNGNGNGNGNNTEQDSNEIIYEFDENEQVENLPATEGLEFREKSGGYEVVGIGTATDTVLVIPSEYNGKPVISIYGAQVYNPTNDMVANEGAFLQCTSITRVIIPDSVTSIGKYAFFCCYNLTKIIIPDSVTYVGRSAFFGCYSLTIYCEAKSQPRGWDAPWDDPDNHAVWDCNNNEVADDGNIYVSVKGIRYALKDGNATVARQPRGVSEEITLPHGIKYKGTVYRVTSIGEWAFNRSGLKSISIPVSVTSICDYAFGFCSGITSMIIPGSVTSIGRSVFSNCSSLTNVTLSNGVTSIGDWAFSECSSLKSIEIPDSVTSIASRAFRGCSSLKSIEIPEGVKSIGERAFSGCSSLTSITIPYFIYAIGSGTFSKCSNLTSIVMYDDVQFIGEEAFSECSSLTSIVIPESVIYMGSNVFEGCNGLTIYCEAESQPDTWDSMWNSSNCTVIWGYKGN